jgi:hypothetical protein
MPESLQEYCSSRGVALRIDRDAGLLRGVKLLGLVSKNGREYPEATLARAASLYDGAKVNVNHPKGHPLAPRDYQDRLGTIRNVIARPSEGLFGDLQYNPKHALAEQLLWDAEHAPENVGFSHNVQARTAKRGEQTIVEEILAVQSVDLVADPATTRGLFESDSPVFGSKDQTHARGGERESGREGGSPTSATQESPPLLVSPSPSPSLCERCVDQTTEIERLREQITELQAAQAIAHKRAAIAALLVEHGLPPMGAGQVPPDTVMANAITSETFIESLLAAPDEPAMRQLIRERAALIEQARRWNAPSGRVSPRRDFESRRDSPTWDQPLSREQTLVEFHVDDSLTAFVKAIRT